MHPMGVGISTADMMQIFEDNIDTIPTASSASIIIEARVIAPVCRIFDGLGPFQFLDV